MTDYWQGKRVGITGGAAMIGTHLAKLLLSQGAEVTVLDDFSSGRRENVDKLCWMRECDLRDPNACFLALTQPYFEVVFHLACAHGGRGYVDTHPVESFDNLALDATVFRALAETGKKPRVVFASSACAYPVDLQDSPRSKPLVESDVDYAVPRNPDGAYGFAKLAGELTLNAYTQAGLLDGVAARMFTVFGPLVKENHAIAAFCAKTLIRQDPFEIWGDGTQLRNWTFVEDTVRGLALVAESGRHGAVNVGVEERYTVLQGAAAVWAAMGWKPKQVRYAPAKPTGPYNRIADAGLAKSLGWSPQVPFGEGVKRTAEWYVQTHDAEQVRAKLEQSLRER